MSNDNHQVTSESDEETRDKHRVDRRGVLKGLCITASSVGAISVASDSALGASYGYGEGGYGVGPYGGSGLTVATAPASDTTATSVTLNGELTDLDGAESATCYFEWRESETADWTTTAAQTRSTTGTFDASVTGLSESVTYEYRAVADASDGSVAVGLTETITTSDSPLSVTTNTAAVDGTTATLNGSVDTLGGATAADCYFQWREVGATSWTATAKQSLSSSGGFSADLSDLSTGTDYEYRAATEATDGDTANGDIITFSTGVLRTPPAVDSFSVTEAGSPDPHLDITVNWSVSDADGDLDTVLVEVRDTAGQLLDGSVTEVTGAVASLSNRIRVKRQDGETADVRITVVDTYGNSSSQSASITE